MSGIALEDIQDSIDLMIAREQNRADKLVNWADIRDKYVLKYC